MTNLRQSFRLTAPVPSETELHETVAAALDYLLCPPAFWFHYPAGSIQLSAAQAAKLTRLGLKRGMPDIFIIHKHLYGIELKVPNGRLSRTRIVRTRRGSPRILLGQEQTFPLLEAAGMQPIVICSSIDEVLAQLEAWAIPLRGRVA